jgi:hypothetical protein
MKTQNKVLNKESHCAQAPFREKQIQFMVVTTHLVPTWDIYEGEG